MVMFNKGDLIRCIEVKSHLYPGYKPTKGNIYLVLYPATEYVVCSILGPAYLYKESKLSHVNLKELAYDSKCFVLETCEVIKTLYSKEQ